MYQPKISLKNLHLASEQEVFDQVAVHLLKQRVKSVFFVNNSCAYRSEEGLMCAAGCLIADDEYTEDIEGANWAVLVLEYNFPNAHSDLIMHLQSIHDGRLIENWKSRLIELAAAKNLSISAIQDL